MRRSSQSTELDLAPIMGLVSLLIPMLLMGYVVPFTVVDANAPAICDGCDGGEDPAVVPTLVLTAEGIRATAEDEVVELEAHELVRLSEVLSDMADRYDTRGQLVIVSEGDVVYERLIAAMDVARPRFPSVTIGGGLQ